MASSPPNPKPLFHARSDSLPSRPHLFRSQLEEHLCRLRATDASSSSSSSISSFSWDKLSEPKLKNSPGNNLIRSWMGLLGA
ncbi:hypothetical protein QQP08_006227 [Theobroma cacao]|nr:hypothetical protein QQP08_006227 [Theobroma cacao]